jgi:hypothetical protein
VADSSGARDAGATLAPGARFISFSSVKKMRNSNFFNKTWKAPKIKVVEQM